MEVQPVAALAMRRLLSEWLVAIDEGGWYLLPSSLCLVCVAACWSAAGAVTAF